MNKKKLLSADDIYSDEVVELIPYVAKHAIECELSVNGGPDQPVEVGEMLAAVKANPPMGMFHPARLDGPSKWCFLTSKPGRRENFLLMAYVDVEGARALRDSELGFFSRWTRPVRYFFTGSGSWLGQRAARRRRAKAT